MNIIRWIFGISLTDKAMGDFLIISAVSFLSALTGLSVGIAVSYLVFKNKGWTAPVKKTDILATH